MSSQARGPKLPGRSRVGMNQCRRVGLALVTALGLAQLAVAAGSQEAALDSPEPGSVEACARCHQQRVDLTAHTPHAVLDSGGLSSLAGAESSCDACHGAIGAESVLRGKISELATAQGCQAVFAFGADETPVAKAQRCLTCHRTDHPRFHASAHALAGMDCTACHDICSQQGSGAWPLQAAITKYASALEKDVPSAMCWECHGDVFAWFELNETHRLREGILECTSCHDPHLPQTRLALGGFKQAECVRCHADKGGPFVFEHPSLSGEGCTICHSPHGSPNRHLLSFQSEGELCFGCHAAVPGFHASFTVETVCTHCHAFIHGSNLDPWFLR